MDYVGKVLDERAVVVSQAQEPLYLFPVPRSVPLFDFLNRSVVQGDSSTGDSSAQELCLILHD